MGLRDHMDRGVKRITYQKGMFDNYKENPNPDSWTLDFPELMWGLGFEMECGNSYQALFKDSRNSDNEILKNL